jgi:hypothetical protein
MSDLKQVIDDCDVECKNAQFWGEHPDVGGVTGRSDRIDNSDSWMLVASGSRAFVSNHRSTIDLLWYFMSFVVTLYDLCR